MHDYKYAYLNGELVFAVAWLLLFIYNRRLRRKMLLMSLMLAPCGPIAELFHTRDYWQPLYAWQPFGIGFEDVLGGFLIGGTSVIDDVLFVERKFDGPREPALTMVIMQVGGWGAMVLLTLGPGLNSIYASMLTSLAMGVVTLVRRPDLTRAAISNAVLMTVMVFVAYQIERIFYPRIFEIAWKLDRLSHLFVGGIPAEEIMWAFAWGFMVGPIYDLFAGTRHVRRRAAGWIEATSLGRDRVDDAHGDGLLGGKP